MGYLQTLARSFNWRLLRAQHLVCYRGGSGAPESLRRHKGGQPQSWEIQSHGKTTATSIVGDRLTKLAIYNFIERILETIIASWQF